MSLKLTFIISVNLILVSCGSAGDDVADVLGSVASGKVSIGEQISLPCTFIRKNTEMKLQATFDVFDSLRLGRGDSLYQGYYVDITQDSLIVNRYVSGYEVVQRVAHRLEIRKDLEVELITADDDSCTISLKSKGKTSVRRLQWWGGGEPYVRNIGHSPMNVVLRFYPRDINNHIWLIGDSYLNWLYEGRWPYYIFRQGYKCWLADNFPGANSKRMLESFENTIQLPLSEPEFAVWTLGMNDSSDNSIAEPDGDWLQCISTFVDVCEEHGITPILATIPSVPTRYHEAKSAWVRKSGYRYIDFAAAVNTDQSGNWKEGMLYSDGVHPSVLGAQALADRVFIDFPEIKN